MVKLIKAVSSKAPKKPKLLIEERRRRILDMLNSHERVTVTDLVEAFDISAVTIRGDLDALDEQGGLVRSHGGAVKRLNPLQDYPIQVKEILHHSAKVRIAQAAARLIRSDQKIILDSGTTTAEIARQINPLLRGWIGYYGRFSRSGLAPLVDYVNQKLKAWIMRKYKRFRFHKTRASLFLRERAGSGQCGTLRALAIIRNSLARRRKLQPPPRSFLTPAAGRSRCNWT